MAKHHLRPLSVNHWTRDNRERSLYNSLAKTYAEVLLIGCGAGGNMGGYSLMQHRQLDTYHDAMKMVNRLSPRWLANMNMNPVCRLESRN